ncbi:MAG TPA: DNA internalization-related competence protein ComEC/Rec2 [Candidatus Hydrogenedens sp.]|nr:DNA internalization-related competence protein ComEC/Rec2 [Candidatus Hydrogenedens sp.]
MLLNRHWVVAAVGLTLGIVVARMQGMVCYLSPLLFAFAIYVFFLNKRFKYLEKIQITILFFSVGSIAYFINPFPREGDQFFLWLRELQPNTYVEVEGYVTENTLFDPSENYLQFVLHILRVKNNNEWINIDGKTLVYCKEARFPVYRHTRVRLYGKSSTYLSSKNPSLWNYEDYLHSQRIYTKIYTTSKNMEIVSSYFFSPFFWTSKLQQYFYERFIQYCPISVRDLAQALWLGDRTELSYEEKQNFIRTGTVHILSISGLHVGLVFWFAQMIGMALFKSRKIFPNIFALFVCSFYTLVSGAYGSSLRALLMLSIYVIYMHRKRNEDILSCLSLTVIVLFTLSPDYLWDIGTQMSIISVASIILFHEPISKLFRFLPEIVRSYLSLSLSAQILLLPLLALTNSQLNLLSPIVNMLVVPLIGFYLMISICGLAIIFIPYISIIFFYSGGLFLLLIQWICAFFGSLSEIIFPLPRPSIATITLYCLVCYFLYQYLHSWKRRDLYLLLAGCVILIFVGFSPFFKQEGHVYILDVGHGDAIVIATPEGENILIDGGTEKMGNFTVVPFLRSKGISLLEYIIVSHADEDHIGGIFPVLENIKTKNFIYGEGFNNSTLGEEMLKKVGLKHTVVMQVKDGQQIDLKKARLNVIYAGRTYYTETNPNSLVIKFSYNDFSILLTGDFPCDLARRELNVKDSSAAVLKIPHHGLKNSINRDMLEITHPKVAVASVNGYTRNWGVRKETKELLNQFHIPLWRTDYYGGITIEFGGNQINLFGARQRDGYILQEDKNSIKPF